MSKLKQTKFYLLPGLTGRVFFILVIFLTSFIACANENQVIKTIVVHANWKILDTRSGMRLAKLFQSKLKSDLKSNIDRQLIVKLGDDTPFNTNTPLKSHEFHLYLVFGFLDVADYFILSTPDFDCSKNTEIMKNGSLNYKYLMDPIGQKLHTISSKALEKKAKVRFVWIGGNLNRNSVLTNKLKCEKYSLQGEAEKFTSLQDAISLNQYPLYLSSLLNVDLLFRKNYPSPTTTEELSAFISTNLLSYILGEL